MSNSPANTNFIESEVDQTYSADDLKTMEILDDKIVHWLATNKLPEDDDLSLLLLEYVDNFSDNDKAALVAELVRHGGVQLSPTAFSFATLDKLFIAQDAIKDSGNFNQFFYQAPALPTIKTKLILSVSETTGKYSQKFKFFKR